MYNVNPYTNIKQDKNIYNHQAQISKELSPSILPKQKRVRSGWYCWPFCLPGSLSIWDTRAGDNDNNNSFRVIYPVKKRALYNTNYRNNHRNTRAHDVIQYHNTITGIHELTTSYSTTIQSQEYTSSRGHTVPQYKLQKQSIQSTSTMHELTSYHNTNCRNNHNNTSAHDAIK